MDKIKENIQKLQEWKFLKKGWNGHNADPLPENLIDKAIDVLRKLKYQPDVFPTARDSIQFEYEKNHHEYLEFELFEDRVELYIETSAGELEKTYTYEKIDWDFIISKFL